MEVLGVNKNGALISPFKKQDMKPKIIQLFQTKAEAFGWIMEVVQDATIGNVNTEATYLTQACIMCETEQTIYIGIY